MKQFFQTLVIALGAGLLAAALFKNLKPTDTKIGNSLQNDQIIEKFYKWAVSQRRLYASPSEMQHPIQVFENSLKEVERLKETVTWEVGLGQFADMTDEEFIAKKTGLMSFDEKDFNQFSLDVIVISLV